MKKLALTCAALTALVFLAVFLFLLLPYIANHHVIPREAKNLPFVEKSLHIASLTPKQIIGSIVLGDENGRGIAVPRFAINYSPESIFSGKITSLVMSSPQITITKNDNGITVSGLQPMAATSKSKKDATLPVLPVKIDKVVIENGVLLYTGDAQLPGILFNVELLLNYDQDNSGKYTLTKVQGHLSSSGMASLECDFTVEENTGGLGITVDGIAEKLDATAWPLLASLGIELSGNMRFHAEVATENLNRLKDFKGTVRFDDFALVRNAIVIKGSGDGSSLAVEVEGDNTHIDYQLEGLQLYAQESVGVSGSGSYFFKSRQIEGETTVVPARTGSDIGLAYKGTAGSTTDLGYSIKGDAFTMDEWLEVEPFEAHGNLQYDDSGFSATLRASFPKVRDAVRDLTVKGISVDLPFEVPERASGVVIPGNIFAEEIVSGDTVIASLTGALSISPQAMRYSAEMTSPLNEQMKVVCSGKSIFAGDYSLDCYLPDVELAAAQFRNVAPIPQKLDFQGEVSAEARFRFGNGFPSGTARISCQDAQVSYDKYRASGLRAELFFPDLPEIRSAGGQEVRIETIDLGNIKMSDATVRLRVDDAETLFVERAKLAWCGGRVETAGLMIKKGMEQLDATLYCDRLGYTELLGQLGIGNAQGEGSLNGRLPMRISRNDIEFDDGFLFSTPGQSGTVRFRDTDQFRQGVGEAGNSVYLEYTLNALENFSYNWTKLMFNTEEDDLLLTLQLDGKPSEPLPYGYREGKIVKKAEGSGLQHPIRLDVNFRLPLQELFRYGKNIQSIMENM